MQALYFAYAKDSRYWIEIKDAKGSIILSAAAVWDGRHRRAAVAKILRLDGVLEPLSYLIRGSGQDTATNFDVEKMAASFAVATPARKKPRH